VNDGRIEGTATLNVSGLTWTNNGTFAPGTSPGVLTVAGSYTNDVLEAELAGSDPGTGYDRLAVSGNATLGGALRVTLGGGFTPTVGNRYTVVTCGGTCAGTFDTLELPAGMRGTVEVSAHAVDLLVTGIAVTSPAPLDVFLPGDQVRIRWLSAGLTGDVRIQIVNAAGVVVRTTHSTTTNTGSKNTTITPATPPAAGYRIRITSLTDNSIVSESGPFAVLDPAFAIAVTEPVEAEQLPLGELHPVVWTSPPGLPASAMVGVWLVRNSDLAFRTRLRREPNDGRASVRIPADLAPGDDYRLELVAESDARYWGRTVPFAVGTFPALTITSPAAGVSWTAGSTQNVGWQGLALTAGAPVTLYLLAPGQPRTRLVRTTNASATGGSWSWAIPAGLAPGAGYQVQAIYDDGAGVRLSKKSGAFSIVPALALAHAAADLPAELTLDGARPNPVRGAAVVRYGLPTPDAVRVAVYDMLGRQVAVLAEGEQAAGWHEAAVPALAAGAYVVRMTVGTSAFTRRITVVR
jgi:hypothetical protein